MKNRAEKSALFVLIIDINKFRNLSSFRFNEVCKYNADDTTSLITLNYDDYGKVSIDGDTNTPKDSSFDDDGNLYYKIDLNKDSPWTDAYA